MENQINIRKNHRSRAEKDCLVLQWQQSGLSRKEFCRIHQVNYNSLAAWCKKLKDEGETSGFSEVKLNPSPSLFAQVQLPGGIKIDFFSPLPSDFISSLLK